MVIQELRDGLKARKRNYFCNHGCYDSLAIKVIIYFLPDLSPVDRHNKYLEPFLGHFPTLAANCSSTLSINKCVSSIEFQRCPCVIHGTSFVLQWITAELKQKICSSIQVVGFFFNLKVKIPASFPTENFLPRSGCQVMAPSLPTNQSGAKLCQRLFLNPLRFCRWFFTSTLKRTHDYF